MKVVSSVGAWLVVLVWGVTPAWFGCSSDGGDGADPGEGPNDPECPQGEACYCDDGRKGEYECSLSPPACYCAPPACPSFAPDTTKLLSSCGGEPFGTWRAKSFEVETGSLLFTTPAGSTSACPVRVTPKDDYSFAFNMTLADGGRAETRIALPPSIIEMSAACVSDAGQFCGGFDIRGEIGDCETDACGLCRC